MEACKISRFYCAASNWRDYGKSNVNRCGLEPKVVGTAFALGANKMSAPIEEMEYMLLKT
jgi:hypothetical protein